MRTRLRRVEVFDDAFGGAHPRHPKEMRRLPRKATSSWAARKGPVGPVYFVSRSVREMARGRGEGSVPGAGGPHDLIAAFKPGHET